MIPDGSFADHPESLAELKAKRSQRPQDWKPRDVLLSLLRDIDGGKVDPAGLVVVYFTVDDDGDTRTRYQQASRNALELLGMLEAVKMRIWRED